MKPEISIIVPIYNVSQYLERSIESLIKQTINKPIEILLIDDGSTDNSLDICKTYEKKDERIKVFHKLNGGVSSARNYGLKVATGKYVGFIDPDDYVSTKMYESMYELAQEFNSEVVICNYNTVINNKTKPIMIDFKKDLFDLEDIREKIIPNMVGQSKFESTSSNIMGSVCRLLISKKIINQNNLSFNTELSLMEDLVFCLELFTAVESIAYDQNCHYFYVKNNNSALTKYRDNTYQERMMIQKYLTNIFEENNLMKLYMERMNNRYIKMCIISIANEARTGNEKKIFQKVKAIKRICNDKILQNNILMIYSNIDSLKTKMLLNLIRYKQASLLYVYYKIKNE